MTPDDRRSQEDIDRPKDTAKISLHRTEEENEFVDRIRKGTDTATQSEILNLILGHPLLQHVQDPFGASQWCVGWQPTFRVYKRSQIQEAFDLTHIDEIDWDADSYQCNDFSIIAQGLFRYKFGIPLAVVDSPSCNHSLNGVVIRNKKGDLEFLLCEPQIDKLYTVEEFLKDHDLSRTRMTFR